MKKRLISILLTVCMLLSSVTAFAVEDEQPEGPENAETALSEDGSGENAELTAYLASLEDVSMEPANPYTPTEVKDLLTAGDTGHAYEPATEAAEPDASHRF